jgi:hypothetical protein
VSVNNALLAGMTPNAKQNRGDENNTRYCDHNTEELARDPIPVWYRSVGRHGGELDRSRTQANDCPSCKEQNN